MFLKVCTEGFYRSNNKSVNVDKNIGSWNPHIRYTIRYSRHVMAPYRMIILELLALTAKYAAR